MRAGRGRVVAIGGRSGRRGAAIGGALALWLLTVPAAHASPAAVTDGRIDADFNADGFSDLAIAAPGERVGGAEGAGSVHVLYGASTGPSPEREQLLDQAAPEFEDEPDPGDAFGSALAAGDFDGDGYADLAIGVPGEAVPNPAPPPGELMAAGAVAVLYGSPLGLTATRDQLLAQGGQGEAAAEQGDRFGTALATGDFDGDGRDDLAVGSSSEAVDGFEDAGAINVVSGVAGGLASPGLFFTQASTGIGGQPGELDRFGAVLASGDLGRGERIDLAVGAPGDEVETVDGAGTITVLYGSSVGPAAVGSKQLSQESRGVPGPARPDDGFGGALATGDFGRDPRIAPAVEEEVSAEAEPLEEVAGQEDLAVGIPFDEVAGRLDAGSVVVFHTRVGGVKGGGSRRLTQESRGVPEHAEAGDEFGAALAAANFGNAGRDDLAIGASGDTVDGIQGAGSVAVLYGLRDGLSRAGADLFAEGHRRVPDFPEPGDGFGRALAVGSLGLGRREDLAVGAPTETPEGPPPTPSAGATAVLYGHRGGLSGAGVFFVQGTGGVEGAPEPRDLFGAALGR